MKKQRLSLLGLLILLLGCFNSCILMGPSIKGNGDVIEEKRDIGEFSKLHVSHGMNVYIKQGDQTEIIVKADENIVDEITTKKDGDQLRIYTEARIKWAKSKKVIITVPDLEKITTTAGSNTFSDGKLVFQSLEIKTTAGSNVHLDMNSEWVKAKASAGSNIFLKGAANESEMSSSSGSNIKAGEFITDTFKGSASSGANIWIHVKDKIKAEASSGGNIFYQGNPEQKDISSSSGGNVIRR